jgi:hypothetical protein
LAARWLGARGFPDDVRALLDAYDPFVAARFVLGWVAPRAVARGPAVARDLFVVAKLSDGALAVIAVAGPRDLRGPSVEDWLLAEPTPARAERVQQLAERLAVTMGDLRALSQPLAQRVAAALIEAERLNATHALMLAHASNAAIDRDERRTLVQALGGRGPDDGLVTVAARGAVQLHLGWVEGEA